ncbi:hypothetical protein HYS91_03230 [Candidatus Daviesbacteria bacterium]|nr:hypothetical protein [Candidatus Daviesbacteria bacterium]
MTATAHALVGGAIASSVSNPALGLTLSALSHPLLDLIPHWDFGRGWKQKSKVKLFLQASLDLGAGVILAYLLFGQYTNLWYFLACIFVSELWDFLQVPYWFFSWRFPPFSTAYHVQSTIGGRAKLPWGIFTQIAVIIGLILALQVFY